MVESKTVVLKTRVDPHTIGLQLEEQKTAFFTKLGFLKPNREHVRLIGYEKYYEPYILIGGKYSLTYYRKHTFNIEVGNQTREIFISGRKFKPKTSPAGKNQKREIHLEGEEHAHCERELFFILDRLRREIPPESFSFAPYTVQTEGTDAVNLSLRRIRVSSEEVIELLRSRIAKRPTDLAEILKETFEINENMIVYRPFFEFIFQNTNTNKYVTLQVDGISGEQVLHRLENGMQFSTINSQTVSDNFKEPFPGKSYDLADASYPETREPDESQSRGNFREPFHEENCNLADASSPETCESDESQTREAKFSEVTLNFPANTGGEVFSVGDNVVAVVGDLEIPSGATVNDTLVVKGRLKIGDNCRISRNVKALGDVWIGVNTVIDGDVISGGNVFVGANSVVQGSIRATGTVQVSETAVVGKELAANLKLRKSFDLQMIINAEKEVVAE